MKATEIMKLMELARTFPPREDKPMRRPRSQNYQPRFDRMSDLDLANMIQRRLAEADAVKKILEDREKAHKKEEKKEEKRLKTEHLAMFLVISYPIIGLLIWSAFHR